MHGCIERLPSRMAMGMTGFGARAFEQHSNKSASYAGALIDRTRIAGGVTYTMFL